MKVFNKTNSFLILSLVLILTAADTYAKSKYEQVKNGIGNVLVGEVLPYNNDEGYKNVVNGSVKLSELYNWETFYYRAFFGKKISEIKHDVRVLIVTFKGVGGEAARFDKDAGGTTITWTLREDDSENYGERTEWSRYFENIQSEPIPFYYYSFPYNPAKPSTFEFYISNTGPSMELTPKQLSIWKDKYNLTRIDVIMQVFAFDNLGETTTGENKKYIEAETDINGNVSYEEKEKLGSIKTVINWGNRQFLAQGKFSIILD